MELPDGSALILSVAKYSAPGGKKIQDDAVQPNVVVASNDDDQDDNQPGQAQKPAAPHADDQLDKALAVLKQKAA
jgi:carboxyl-terminal processing protease